MFTDFCQRRSRIAEKKERKRERERKRVSDSFHIFLISFMFDEQTR